MKALGAFILSVSLSVSAQVAPYAGKINHVIVIIQENRSFDHYFGHLSGILGNPVTTGPKKGSGMLTLTHQDPNSNYNNPAHDYLSIVGAIDGGAMDDFPHSAANGYAYYDGGDIPFYYDMATHFGLATNYWPLRGPSYPTHFGFVAVPTDLADNPHNVNSAINRWTCFYNSCNAPGCKYPASGLQPIVNDILNYPANINTAMYHAGVCSGTRTACTDSNAAIVCAGQGGVCDLTHCMAGSAGCMCPSVTTVGANLSTAGISHTWYGPGKGVDGVLWEAPYYEQAAAFGSESGHMAPNSQFLTDVSGNALSVITWISPPRALSEHPDPNIAGMTVHNGSAWVESLIRQCFNYHANCYDHALILLTWDDGGGYYDHVAPRSTQDGVRVPLLCIGPYCKNRFTSTYLTQAGVLKCVEDVAGIGYLGKLDTNATSVCKSDGSAMINLSQTPIPAPAPAPLSSLSVAKRFTGDSPDVIDAASWLLHKLHPEHEKEPPTITLQERPCDPSTPLRDWATFKPTGQMMEWCHDKDNDYILPPGQTLDDKEDSDDKPKAKQPGLKSK